MDEQLIEILARAAGLERALRDHRDDVIAAAANAFDHHKHLDETLAPAVEPWPPMRPGIGR